MHYIEKTSVNMFVIAMLSDLYSMSWYRDTWGSIMDGSQFNDIQLLYLLPFLKSLVCEQTSSRLILMFLVIFMYSFPVCLLQLKIEWCKHLKESTGGKRKARGDVKGMRRNKMKKLWYTVKATYTVLRNKILM